MRRYVVFFGAIAFAAVCLSAMPKAQASQEDDVHRIAIALESIARHVGQCGK